MSILTKPTLKKVWVTYVNKQYETFFCGFFPTPFQQKRKLSVLVIYIYMMRAKRNCNVLQINNL